MVAKETGAASQSRAETEHKDQDTAGTWRARRDISPKIWSAGSWVGALSLLIGCRIGAPSRVDALLTGLPSRRNLRKGSVVGSSLTSTLGVTQDQEQSECPERGPRGQERALAKAGQGKRTRNPGQQSSRFSGRRPLLLARFFGSAPFVSELQPGGSSDSWVLALSWSCLSIESERRHGGLCCTARKNCLKHFPKGARATLEIFSDVSYVSGKPLRCDIGGFRKRSAERISHTTESISGGLSSHSGSNIAF